ncbi:MAG TPA: hypothetical protein VN943_00790 [Candidatus Acidoferrum sp.]|nr:hypothetical protein [Candidatus Acidoferrum sp.]
MTIAKGLLLGIWLFSFGTITFLYFAIFRKASGGMIGGDIIAHLTTHSPVWWVALVACVAFGLFITRSWSGRPILWIALAVTELFPMGLLVMFLTLVARNKEMVDRANEMLPK